MRPSCFFMYTRGATTTKNPIMIITSITTGPPVNLNGKTVPVTPRIRRMLKIFDPNIAPSAIPHLPLMPDIIKVATSGRDVPSATMVRPITSSDIPRSSARVVAPWTNRLEPK